MTKMLESTCIANVVLADTFPVVGCEILSEGIGASEGVTIIDENRAYYFTSSAQDLHSALNSVVDALTKICANPLVGPVCVAEIAALTALKETLK